MVSQIEYDYLKAVAEYKKRLEELRDAQESEMDQDIQNPNPPILTHPEPNAAPSRHEPVDAQERELLEAVERYSGEFLHAPLESQKWNESAKRLYRAYHAYDPPKPKKYTMPEWEVFAEGKTQTGYPNQIEYNGGKDYGICRISKPSYNALREATAIEE